MLAQFYSSVQTRLFLLPPLSALDIVLGSWVCADNAYAKHEHRAVMTGSALPKLQRGLFKGLQLIKDEFFLR